MERVAFIKANGERISCMLNPEDIVQRRFAGLAPRRTGSGVSSGMLLSDTPMLHTGGGRTEVELQLLFDVDLLPTPVPSSPPVRPTTDDDNVAPPVRRRDVRDYTRPLWDLAENSDEDGRGVPLIRFVLGKQWNMLALVESLAERFERFDTSGTPGRSWLTMRLVRVPDPNPPAVANADPVTIPDAAAAAAASTMPIAVHTVIGAGPAADGEGPAGGETLPQLSARYFGGRSALWRWIADVNLLDDVVWPDPGRELLIPPAPEALSSQGGP